MGFMALTDAPPIAQGAWIPEDSFATRLIAARKGRGLTQERAAEQCGLDDGSWSNWENGSKPRAMNEVVRKISIGLNVDREWLMWGRETTCPHCGEVVTGMTCFLCNPQVSDPNQLTLDVEAVERYANGGSR